MTGSYTHYLDVNIATIQCLSRETLGSSHHICINIIKYLVICSNSNKEYFHFHNRISTANIPWHVAYLCLSQYHLNYGSYRHASHCKLNIPYSWLKDNISWSQLSSVYSLLSLHWFPWQFWFYILLKAWIHCDWKYYNSQCTNYKPSMEVFFVVYLIYE